MTGRAGTSEDDWEQFAKEHLTELAWRPLTGHDIAPGSGEREKWDDLHIPSRMFAALRRFNPEVPTVYLQQALADIVAPRSEDAIFENHRIHEWLTGGYRGVTYIDADGQETTPTIHLISSDPNENDWLVANQITLRGREGYSQRVS